MAPRFTHATPPAIDGHEAAYLRIRSGTPSQILDIKPGATFSDIRRTYHRLILLFHPDKCHPINRSKYTEAFRRIQEAYEYFVSLRGADGENAAPSDEAVRREYKRQGEEISREWGPVLERQAREREENDEKMREIRRKAAGRLNGKFRRPGVKRKAATSSSSSSLSEQDDEALPWEWKGSE